VVARLWSISLVTSLAGLACFETWKDIPKAPWEPLERNPSRYSQNLSRDARVHRTSFASEGGDIPVEESRRFPDVQPSQGSTPRTGISHATRLSSECEKAVYGAMKVGAVFLNGLPFKVGFEEKNGEGCI